MNLSISMSIVVYHPNMDLLEKVFSHLKIAINKTLETLQINFTLHVIDNSVSTDVAKKIPHMLHTFFENTHSVSYQLIISSKNIGYGAANNLSIRQANSDYHLVMNPDVFLYEDTFLNAIHYMEAHLDIGLLTPDVYGTDGVRHYLCKKNPTLFDMFLRSCAPSFLKNKFSKRMREFEMRDKNYDAEIVDVPFPTGCFMFMRTSILKKLHGFDERFFLYYEDADMGRRLLEISHSAYVPHVKIVHQWARESRKNLKMLLIFVKSAFIYWRKYGGLF